MYDVAPTRTRKTETTLHVGLLEDEGIVVNQINDGLRVAMRRAKPEED